MDVNFLAQESTTRAFIGQRVLKTPDNPYGFQLVDCVPFDRPAVLVLTGSGTRERSGEENGHKSANGYLSDVERILKSHGIKDGVDLYALIHHFGRDEYGKEAFDDAMARKKLLADHHVPFVEEAFYSQHKPKFSGGKYVLQNSKGQKIEQTLNNETLNPTYVDELFDKTFLPRLCDEKGEKLPVEEACRRLRNLTVVAHCHGAYTFLKIEEKMQQKMNDLGYSSRERAQIQKQLLCVACAPEAPLGVSKSTMISFASAADAHLTTDNNFARFVRYENFPAAYFPDKHGEVFLAKTYTSKEGRKAVIGGIEHAFFRFEDEDWHSKDWMFLFDFFSNAVANGVRGSIEGRPLSSVKDLVCGDDERANGLFEQMKTRGEILWHRMIQRTKLNSKFLRSSGR